MTYPKTLPPEGELILSRILPKLDGLTPSRSLSIPCSSKSERDTVRYYLYAYLHNSGTKPYFRVRSEGETRLIISRLHTEPPTPILSEDSPLSQTADLFLTSLIAYGPEDTSFVLKRLTEARSNVTISQAESIEIYRRWLEFHGAPTEDCSNIEHHLE